VKIIAAIAAAQAVTIAAMAKLWQAVRANGAALAQIGEKGP